MKKPPDSRIILGACVILAVAILFGSWFKERQISLLGVDLPGVYPLSYRLETVILLFLFLISVWLAWGALFKRALSGRDLSLLLYRDAFSFLPLTLALGGFPLKGCVALSIGVKAAVLAGFIPRWRSRPMSRVAVQHLVVLAVILLTQAAFDGFLSPFAWNNPLAVYMSRNGDLPTSVPLFNSLYVNAKQFCFSDLDHSYWAGVGRSPMEGYSLLVPLIALVGDLPSISIEVFRSLIEILGFIWCVGGSFGFYLFLFYALRLSFPVAACGGILFVFSNSLFALSVTQEFPLFLGSFLTLPFALLLSRLSFRSSQGSACAALAGLVLALPFYILAPHPVAFAHGFSFFLLYLGYNILFNREEPRFLKRLSLGLLSLLTLAVASSAYLVPIFESVFTGQAHYFGHRQIEFASGGYLLFRLTEEFFLSTGILALPGFIGIATIGRRCETKTDFIFFAGTFLLFPIFYVGMNWACARMAHAGMGPAYFMQFDRIAMYFLLSGFIFSLYGLDALARSSAPSRTGFTLGLFKP